MPVSLENLLKIGQLKPHPADAAEIARLLTAEQRNLRDAGVKSISPETRFDAAYKGIMQTALVLQYVAMTRATHELVMTSSRWSRFSEQLRGLCSLAA